MTSRTIDIASWRVLPLLDQMANIGAEVGRTFNARRAAKEERYWAAMQRALDLFTCTMLTEKDRQAYRLKEVGRAKEEFLRIATAEQFDESDARRLEAYFLWFGLASRSKLERRSSESRDRKF